MRLPNDALVAKGLWRLELKCDHRAFKWVSVCGFRGTSMNSSWEAMNSVKCIVGDGSNTCFWELGDSSFSTLFPRTHHISSLRSCPVTLLGGFHLCLSCWDTRFWSSNPSKEFFWPSFLFILVSPHTSRNPRKVEISNKVNVFYGQVLYGRVKAIGGIRRHFSLLLGLQWGILRTKAFEILNHFLGSCHQFTLAVGDSLFEASGVCLALNRDSRLMLEEVLFHCLLILVPFY